MADDAVVHTFWDIEQRHVLGKESLEYLRRVAEEEVLEQELRRELGKLKDSLATTTPVICNLVGWYTGAFLVDHVFWALLRPSWLVG